jgi:anti-repressor protein
MINTIPFEFESLPIRAVNAAGVPWFVAKDVCEALGYSKPRDAVAKHIDDDERASFKVDTLGGAQTMTCVNESGVYSLIIGSQKPEAKKFKRWVTSEVLPSIRKNGGYIAGQEETDDPALIMARALQVAQRVIDTKTAALEQATKTIEQQKPKVSFYDQVTGSKDAVDIGRAAKVLNIRGYGRTNLFKFLRDEKILQDDNLPYQTHIDAGRFRVVETKWSDPTGEIRISYKTMVYQRGLDYIRKRIEKRHSSEGALL